MSWMKRPQAGAPPRPEHPGYAPAPTQPYGNQQNMFPNYQGPPSTQQQQQQMWQMPQQQQQYNQQYGQVYQQQPFVNNSQYFQQPQQYNQNFANQNYDNTQQGFQQNYYQNQVPPVQNLVPTEGNSDGWEDNWNWGWEDTSKQQQKPVSQLVSNQPTAQLQHYNNANVLEESFVSTNTWNWSVEEKKELDIPPSNANQNIMEPQNQKAHLDNSNNDLSTSTESSNQRRVSNVSAHEVTEDIKKMSDKEVIKEHLPNLALGKRFNLENLTPQWSIESQMSQDSSDGPQTHSEGTYRSENQSRNSSKCSPGPHTDTSYSQSGVNETSLPNSEWSKQSADTSLAFSMQNNNRRESCDELTNSVQEMTIAKDNSDQDLSHPSDNVEKVAEYYPESNQFMSQPSAMPPPPPVSSVQSPAPSVTALPASNNIPLQPPCSLPPPPTSLTSAPPSNLTSAPPSNLTSAPPSNLTSAPPSNLTSAPPSNLTSAPQQNLQSHSSALPIPPPTNFSTSSGQNPFKSSNPFSHKNVAKVASANPQLFPAAVPGVGLTSPAAVNKIVQQDRLATSYGVNLETTPDNSERPDQPQVANYRQLPINSQIPDNLEVAPQNDRNEYLQTAHLSIADFGENTDFTGNIAPPGLRRMGVGQQELEYNQSLNISGDEPPPGLARMVPGQQTESDNSYSQRDDGYMDRQIDGQPTDTGGRPYGQADGQHTADGCANPTRRPVGLHRMVPGEPSNDEFPQYQPSGFTGPNEHRVVTGVDHEYTMSAEVGPTDVREQNVDGSDYTEPVVRNAQRSIIGARMEEVSNTSTPDYGATVDDRQREITMEGENLQDLSLVSSTEISFARETTYDGINVGPPESAKDRGHEAADDAEYATNNSRQSLDRASSGEESERERGYRASPRRDREKPKSSRDRDRGRYSRSDRKHDRDPDRRSARDERRGDKDRRERDRDGDKDRRERDRDGDKERRERERDGRSPDGRRHRRGARGARYDTEDTDVYSDRERERRRYREGSYTSSKPPRGEERSRRRPGAGERERRHDDERARRGSTRDGRERRDRDERDSRDPARFERRYRPIDLRKGESLLRARDRDDDDRKKAYSSGSRAGSREATDEEPTRPRDDRRRHRQPHYYDGYVVGAGGAGGAGAGWDARRQYSYYEHLRRADPAAYMLLYKQLMDPRHPLYAHSYYDGYGAGYGAERGSVHSGRSSEAGLKHPDTYDVRARDAASLRTDLSDRELTTDMSLNLQLEESASRSGRMTPLKFSAAHVKCCVGASTLAVSRGREARVQLLPLAALARDPLRDRLDGYPGPLAKGVTHKKSVVEYCERRAREAAAAHDARAAPDATGAALLWELLALLLRQNGVVVGSDIAELLMKNTKRFEYKPPSSKNTECGSSLCEDEEEEAPRPDDLPPLLAPEEQKKPAVDEKEALEKFREYLIYGNKQEALEWAMQCGLWAHALQLSWAGDRRARAAVSARFVAALGAADPLHSLYAALAGRAPPALACVSDERWGDWRPHAAILLANSSARPDQDRRNLTQLGDTLSGRGLIYSAQFCYVAAGEPLAAHPLEPLSAAPAPAAPPRLALLLADPRAATLRAFATDHAIFATEIYEYALSLGRDRVLDELVPYKLLMATRFTDAGDAERALRYAEHAARALTARPARPNARALARALATLADRLKYFDPALQDEPEVCAEGGGGAEGGGSEEPSPRHQQWLSDLATMASQPAVESSQTSSPQHGADLTAHDHTQYSWPDQTLQQQQHQMSEPVLPAALALLPAVQSQYCQQQQYPEPEQQQQQYEAPQYEQYGAGYDEQQPYGDPYWQSDTHYGYHDGEAPRPTITMPGANRSPALEQHDQPPQLGDRDTDSPKGPDKESKSGDAGGGGGEARAAQAGERKGWLSGVFSKLSLRPSNQMILPDDKNPTIVWDEENKRWRDTASGASGERPGPPPPPPAGPPAGPPPALAASTPLASPVGPAANMLRMQKGRHIKKSYVDVLNPGGAAPPPAAAAPPPAPAPAPPAAYFVPAPLPHQGGIYDPTQLTDDDYRTGI